MMIDESEQRTMAKTLLIVTFFARPLEESACCQLLRCINTAEL